MGAIAISLGLILGPAAIGAGIVSDARHDVFFENRIDFARQMARPLTAEGVLETVGYDIHNVAEAGTPVPRIYLASLPENLRQLHVDERKQVFVTTLLPLVLRANEMILQDRERLRALRARLQADEPLPEIDHNWLLAMAEKYKLSSTETLEGLIDRLLKRVDIIPPSLAIAQAAIESGWGTSRFSRLGNALFGQWTWSEDGIVPKERDEGQRHRVRAFDYLIESVSSYMHNLNTHPAYRQLRGIRARERAEGRIPSGYRMAEGLISYSQRRGAYVEELHVIMDANNFDVLDAARLEPRWWAGL